MSTKWSNTLEKCYSKCCKSFDVCLTILWTLGIIGLKQKQPVEEFYRKGVFKNFAIFVGKQLCWSLFLLELQTSNLCNIVLSKKKTKTNKQTNKQNKTKQNTNQNIYWKISRFSKCFSYPRRGLEVRFPLNEINVLCKMQI